MRLPTSDFRLPILNGFSELGVVSQSSLMNKYDNLRHTDVRGLNLGRKFQSFRANSGLSETYRTVQHSKFAEITDTRNSRVSNRFRVV